MSDDHAIPPNPAVSPPAAAPRPLPGPASAAERRAETATRLAGGATLMGAAAFAVLAYPHDRPGYAPAPSVGPPVAAGPETAGADAPDADAPTPPAEPAPGLDALALWAERAPHATTITLTPPGAPAGGAIRLERGEGGWVLPDRGGFAANTEAVAALDRALADAGALRPGPNDLAAHEPLGVTDPHAGGAGTRIEVRDDAGAALLSLIVGPRRSDGTVALRAPGSDATAFAALDLPDLADPSAWLDARVLDHPAEAVIEVRVDPPGTDRSYVLVRAEGGFALAEPAVGWRLTSPDAGDAVALATAPIRFLDVRPAGELTTAPVATHGVRRADGLALDLALYEVSDAERWVTIAVGAADTPEALAAAAALRAKVDGWAFRLPPFTHERLVRPLAEIAGPIAGPDDRAASPGG